MAVVEDFLTKPEIQPQHFPEIVRTKLSLLSPIGAQEYLKHLKESNPEVFRMAKDARNKQYLESFASGSDTIFCKKLADSLSNIRNIDAFILSKKPGSPGELGGKQQIIRKCQEILEFLLPRAQRIAPSYYVQFISEIESLKKTYNFPLNMGMHSSNSGLFAHAVQVSMQQGIQFRSVKGRRLSEDISVSRVSLEARRFKF